MITLTKEQQELLGQIYKTPENVVNLAILKPYQKAILNAFKDKNITSINISGPAKRLVIDSGDDIINFDVGRLQVNGNNFPV